MAWWSRVRNVFRDARVSRDIDDELRAHVEEAIANGRDPEDVRRAFGSALRHREASRDVRLAMWLEQGLQDARYGLRTLGRTPTFTAVVLLTLAMGIGANTAVFSVLNAVVLKPLPYPQADDLVGVWHTAPGAPGLSSVSGDLRLSASMYFTYAEQNRAFQHLGIWFPNTATVTGFAEPEEVRAIGVSDGVLQALAVPPLAGRSLSADDQSPYAVSQRTREMGIRLALGAQRGDLTRMFVRAGLTLAAAGVPIGIVASTGLTRVLASLLYGVSPLDPATYAAVPVVLIVAVVVASYVPARRAARVDPVEALRVG